MMHDVFCNDPVRLFFVLSTSIQIAVKEWEVAARYFEANSMIGRKVVARITKRYL
jgi:hypothetical protein